MKGVHKDVASGVGHSSYIYQAINSRRQIRNLKADAVAAVASDGGHHVRELQNKLIDGRSESFIAVN
jgi:hypothetical protein